MNEVAVLIAGKAGFGIDTAGLLIGRLLCRLGFYIHIYRDYPSLIRGGHTFCLIRAADRPIGACRKKIDFLLALNQDSIDFHQEKCLESTVIIFDRDAAKSEGMGIAASQIVKDEAAPEITRNIALIAAFTKASGISWDILEEVIKKHVARDIELNIKVARRGYDSAELKKKIDAVGAKVFPILTGNEATGLGLMQAGLDTYVSYPMTPTSPVLHFLAGLAEQSGMQVIHPENEIAVMLMALGFAASGKRCAVGTSGGGFCLMTEGLSFSAMAELPVVIVMGQRPGPSTGLPTYSCQTELDFCLSAGQGEFLRFICAPGDSEEAYYWSAAALNLAWKFQIPAFLLTDKNLGEGAFSFNRESSGSPNPQQPLLWDKNGEYKRYALTESGVSPLAYFGESGAWVKISSYEHDEFGITTEDAKLSKTMQDKRLRKESSLIAELESYPCVKAYANLSAENALVAWGSNKWVATEVAEELNLRLVQPLVLNPFPLKQMQEGLKGVKKIICVENNATGQLAALLEKNGFKVSARVLKYDGRPFFLEELKERLKEVL